MFGVSSNKSEAAKALLYPHPSDADMQVTISVCWSIYFHYNMIPVPGGF